MRPNSFDGCLTDPPYGLSFMNKAWDRGIPGPETWREVLRVLKPGAFLLAFGGTRTYHRLTCAIEDAGFEIRDCLMWLYGSGFPKAKSCLKPAYEPIILARKRGPMLPLAIDACRIAALDSKFAKNWDRETCNDMRGGNYGSGRALRMVRTSKAPTDGRWPANVLLGDDETRAALDAQSGTSKSIVRRSEDRDVQASTWTLGRTGVTPRGHADSGGASRFFYCAKASASERHNGSRGVGALRDGSRGVENTHPTVKPLKLTEYLARLILPSEGGKLIVPFSGSGSEMLGARRAGWKVTGIEMNREYIDIANARLKKAA